MTGPYLAADDPDLSSQRTPPSVGETYTTALVSARSALAWKPPPATEERRMIRRVRRKASLAVALSRRLRARPLMRASLGSALSRALAPLRRLRRKDRLFRAALELQLFAVRTWKLWVFLVAVYMLWLWRNEILALAKTLREMVPW